MHKLIAILICILSISGPTMAEDSNKHLITHAQRIQILAEASQIKPRDRKPYVLALIRQGETNVLNRICAIKLKDSGSVAIVNLQTATACQFLSWHNIQLLSGKFTEDQARRFSEKYFDDFVNNYL